MKRLLIAVFLFALASQVKADDCCWAQLELVPVAVPDNFVGPIQYELIYVYYCCDSEEEKDNAYLGGPCGLQGKNPNIGDPERRYYISGERVLYDKFISMIKTADILNLTDSQRECIYSGH